MIVIVVIVILKAKNESYPAADSENALYKKK